MEPEMMEDVEGLAEQPIFQRLYELSPEDKEKVLEEQLQRFKESKQFMEAIYPSMLKNYKKYRSIAEPMTDELGRKIKGRSNIFVPYPWGIVESEMPRMAGRLPRVRAFPRKPSEKVKVESIQDLLLYTFDRMQFI